MADKPAPRPWVKSEDDVLVRMAADPNTTMADIADILGRTVKSCKSRLYRLSSGRLVYQPPEIAGVPDEKISYEEIFFLQRLLMQNIFSSPQIKLWQKLKKR